MEKVWWYAIGDNKVGPISEEVLLQHLAEDQINLGSLVWKEGWDNWRNLKDAQEINARVLDVLREKQAKAPPPLPSEKNTISSARLLTDENQTTAIRQSPITHTGFFSKLIHGDFGLAKTYWLFGVSAGVAISIPATLLKSYEALLVMLLVTLMYQIPVLIGIWRAATKYTGPKIWRGLAKAACVFGALTVISAPLIALGPKTVADSNSIPRTDAGEVDKPSVEPIGAIGSDMAQPSASNSVIVRMPDGIRVKFPASMSRDEIGKVIQGKYPDVFKTKSKPRGFHFLEDGTPIYEAYEYAPASHDRYQSRNDEMDYSCAWPPKSETKYCQAKLKEYQAQKKATK